MKKIGIKLIVYTFLSFLLVLIDWTRGSQVGSTWAWTVNMMGVVIALFLITTDGWRHFFKRKYYIFSVIMILIIPASYLWWERHQTVIYRDKLLSAVCNVWALGICFIRLLEQGFLTRFKHQMMNSRLVLIGTIILLLMSVSKNEDIWPLWFLIIFVMVYCWSINEEDIGRIINGIINGIIISFFVLQGAAFVFRPFDDKDFRYPGIYSNTNMNALFYSIVLIAVLFRLYQLREQNASLWKRVVLFMLSASLVGFSVLTVCKTGWIAEILCIAVYVLVADIKRLKKRASWVSLRILVFLLTVVISVPVVYLPVRYLPPMFHHPVWYEGEYAEWKVHSWDPADSPKYVSFDEVMGAVSSRLRPITEKLFSNEKCPRYVCAEEIVDPKGIHIGQWFFPWDDERTQTYSSYLGRLATWYYYFTNGSLLGHSNLDGHRTGVGESYNWHAQNVFLQIWYYYGIPAGVLFLITAVGAWVLSINRAWRTEGAKGYGAVFVMMYLSLFLLFGLFEAVWYPGQMILTLAVFGPRLMIDSKGLEEKKDKVES